MGNDTNPRIHDVRAHESSVEGSDDTNRMLSRRSPVSQSTSGLVSRDHQPRTGGPELVASWPLGPAPSQTGLDAEDWEITDTAFVTLQENLLRFPYALPVDYSRAYLGVVGRGAVDEGETLTIALEQDHLSGKPYETAVDLANAEPQPFVTPMIEVGPETPEYEPFGRVYGGYSLSAKVSGGAGRLHQGTNVALWSE